MTVLLGCLAAILFGTGDLLAGVGGRRDPSASTPLGIAFTATVIGTVLSGAYLLLSGDGLSGNDIWWAIVAGVVMSAARPLLYRGMTAGPIVVFAPTIGLVSLVLPAVLGLAFGQTLVALEVLGVILALPAVVMLSSGESLPTVAELTSSAAVINATVVGVLISIGALCLSFIEEGAGVAPAFVIVAIGIPVIPALGGLLGMPFKLTRTAVSFGSLIGTTSITALILATFAYRGNAAIGSALVGLSPGVAILLAWKFLGEKFWRLQVMGGILGLIMIMLFALA